MSERTKHPSGRPLHRIVSKRLPIERRPPEEALTLRLRQPPPPHQGDIGFYPLRSFRDYPDEDEGRASILDAR
jgi:hypothetical protein